MAGRDGVEREVPEAMTAVYVALAGAAGVLARYGISSPFHGSTLPWITVAINVVGSFLLGMLVVAHWASPEVRTTLGVGFLGGFTTFSTFSVQAWLDIDAGEPGRAVVFVVASVALGIGAAAAGYATGKAL
jgi:CrcB protein